MEGNNVKAMFEALAEIVFITMKVGRSIKADVACGIIAAKAKHALKTPPRNCDVGTVEEQKNRYWDFCSDNHVKGCFTDGNPMSCPIAAKSDCRLAWAQLPYTP